MATPEEIEETLEIIKKAWCKAPTLRLGQLLSNSALIAEWPKTDLFYLGDAQLKYGLEKFIKGIKVS